MLARIRKSMEEKDQGFTLIELLVVMIIIGILAAIAIPVFLNQRQRAVDSSMKADARTVANELETIFVDAQRYVAVGTAANPLTLTDGGTPARTTNVQLSTGNVANVAVNGTGAAFCVTVTRATGAQPGSQAGWVYVSSRGGLQAAGTTACPAAY
ncbi:prepilin-type N-terminal cleavage/methylation domain-containing protein [Aquipuribacter nitratireducens]|uniref:prepilin-type N-terminal cleavage/methylation domain-containing protein n=1 Tax=Aquipuribacter nitratireducens TaxID=650104 RepID=UPI0030EF97D2